MTNFLQLGPTSYSFHPLREVLLIVNVSMNELIGEMGALSLSPFPSLPFFLFYFSICGTKSLVQAGLRTLYVAKDDFELPILLPLPLER